MALDANALRDESRRADGDATRPQCPAALPIEARIVIFALCFRVVGATVGFIANVTIPDYQNQGFTVLERPNPFWDRFARYDSGWYYGIAAKGYSYRRGRPQQPGVLPALSAVDGRASGG